MQNIIPLIFTDLKKKVSVIIQHTRPIIVDYTIKVKTVFSAVQRRQRFMKDFLLKLFYIRAFDRRRMGYDYIRSFQIMGIFYIAADHFCVFNSLGVFGKIVHGVGALFYHIYRRVRTRLCNTDPDTTSAGA